MYQSGQAAKHNGSVKLCKFHVLQKLSCSTASADTAGGAEAEE